MSSRPISNAIASLRADIENTTASGLYAVVSVNDLSAALDHIAALEQQLAAERARVVNLPERIIDSVCLKAAEIHNLGRGLDDDDAQGVIDSIREVLEAGIPVEEAE